MTTTLPPLESLHKLLVYARDEAAGQSLPLVEYLLGMALQELNETIDRRGAHGDKDRGRAQS